MVTRQAEVGRLRRFPGRLAQVPAQVDLIQASGLAPQARHNQLLLGCPEHQPLHYQPHLEPPSQLLKASLVPVGGSALLRHLVDLGALLDLGNCL